MWVYKRRRRQFLFFILLLFVVALTIFLFIRFKLIFVTLCKNEIQASSQEIVYKVVTNKLDVLEKNLLDFEKDENGEITFVNSNVIYMNKLANEISIDISEQINKLDYLYVNVPMGSLLGSDMLNSLGPSIKIRFTDKNQVYLPFNSSFTGWVINISTTLKISAPSDKIRVRKLSLFILSALSPV